MARVARQDVSRLFPPDCERIDDLPADLYSAIQHSFIVLSWLENLTEDDRPPEWMWPFSDEISDYFDDLRRARASGNDYADLDRNELADEYLK